MIRKKTTSLNSNTIINMTEKIEFNLNGKNVDLTVDPNLILMWVLRVNFGLTGTKFGCGLGFCGAISSSSAVAFSWAWMALTMAYWLSQDSVLPSGHMSRRVPYQ